MTTVDQIDCGLVLLLAGDKPQHFVVEVELGEAGNDGGEHVRGGRSSGLGGKHARLHNRTWGWPRSTRGDVLSAVVSSGASLHGRGHGGDMAGGKELSAPMAMVVRGHGRALGEGETVAELTTITKRGSACSETAWRRRIRRWSPAAVLGEDDSWRRCGAPAVAWLGVEGRGGRGRASGPVREVRERRWPRWCLSAATAALGRGWGESGE